AAEPGVAGGGSSDAGFGVVAQRFDRFRGGAGVQGGQGAVGRGGGGGQVAELGAGGVGVAGHLAGGVALVFADGAQQQGARLGGRPAARSPGRGSRAGSSSGTRATAATAPARARPSFVIGRYPTFMECAGRHAAIEMGRSSSRDRPPGTAGNASASSGSRDITSRTASGRSTRGTIAVVRVRRPASDGDSSTAFTPVRWIFPASSTRT